MTDLHTEALNCPNCGAAVSSDKIRCEFCRSRLKTVGCRACFGRMFLGSKFCVHCGASTVVATESDRANIGECPRCRRGLAALEIGSIMLHECSDCGGMWASVETFENICADREKQSALVNFAGSKRRLHEGHSTINYVPCPDCRQLMNRSNFARSSGVIIDLCRSHGVWFDADELPKIIEFISTGGVARSREKEKADIRDERARLRDEQRRISAIERRSGSGWLTEDHRESRAEGFIASLFDL